MRHSSVIDTVIGRCLRRSLLGDCRVHLLPDHFERRRITGQVRQRGLPLVADRLLLLVRESVVQINGEPIVFTLRVEGGPHVGEVDRDRISFEQLIEVVVVTGGSALVDRSELFGEDLLDAVRLEIEFGHIFVRVSVLNGVEGDVLVDHHVDASRVGVVEDGAVLNADVDVVGRVVVLLGFVVLANLEFDARAVGNRLEDRSELLFGPLVLPFDAKIEVLRESPRLWEIQLGQRGPAFEQEVVAVAAREDAPEEPRIDVVLFGVALPNAQFASDDPQLESLIRISSSHVTSAYLMLLSVATMPFL